MKFKLSIKIAFFVVAIRLIFPQPAFAYLDPGTGSYIIQLLIGAVLGGGYLIKTYWREIKTKFNQLTKKDSQDDDQPITK